MRCSTLRLEAGSRFRYIGPTAGCALPGTDGLEVLRRLRGDSRTATLPVVMLTAFASSSNTIEAMKLGAFEHLTKPLRRREIEALLGRMLSPVRVPVQSPEPAHDRLI